MKQLDAKLSKVIERQNEPWDDSILPPAPEGWCWTSGTENNIRNATNWRYLCCPEDHPEAQENECRIIWVCKSECGKMCAGHVETEYEVELEPEDMATFPEVLRTLVRLELVEVI